MNKTLTRYVYIVEPPIPDHGPIKNPHGAIILIRLGLNFDHSGTNIDMTQVPAWRVKVRRNERLWETLDIGNVVGPTFGFRIS